MRYLVLTIFSIISLVVKSQQSEEGVFKVTLMDHEEKYFDTLVSMDYLQNELYSFIGFRHDTLDHISKGRDSIELYNSNVRLSITSEKVEREKYNFTFKEGEKYVQKLNGKPFWGTDGGIPKRNISKMVLTLNDKKHIIDNRYYADLFNPNLHCNVHDKGEYCYTSGYLRENGDIIVSMLNSDGAGGYIVIFVIDNKGNVKDRIVGHGF